MIDDRRFSVDEQIMPPIIEAYAKGKIDSSKMEEICKRLDEIEADYKRGVISYEAMVLKMRKVY